MIPVETESSWGLREFAESIKGMTLDAFRERYPHPFLLILGHHKEEGGAFRTGQVNVAPASRAPERPASLAPDRLVEIRKSGRNTFANMVSLGRSSNNDIVVEHTSISKLHAFFRESPDGTLLTDSGSRNGTTVDGRRLMPHKPVRLESGQSVVFGGAVKSLFLTPEGVHEHIRGLLFFKKL
jgi:hypothetical protein